MAVPHFAGAMLLALLASAGSARADKPPEYTEKRIAAGAGSAGPTIKLEGKFGSRYRAYEVADNTTFDLTNMVFFSKADHPTNWKFTIGEQPAPPRNIRMTGGVFHGMIPLEWSWTITHAFSGAAFLTVASGQHIVEDARIHNVQDGWRPRETATSLKRAYPNNASFLMRRCYMTGIRDDCVENDEFMPGAVEDSLFDGVWTFLSEQNEPINGVRTLALPTIGPDEDPVIRITRVLLRLAVTNAGDTGPGTWFKFHGYESRNHKLVITDSVFAVDQKPRNGWKQLNFPKTAEFKGTNTVLWLGAPGAYQATIPSGVTFVEGEAARARWHQLRNEWLAAHGYALRGPNDWDSMKAPVEAPKFRRPGAMTLKDDAR